MIPYIGATILVISFIACIKLFHLVEMSLDVINISKMATADIRNPEMDDEAKEITLQAHAIKLFKLFLLLTLGGALALLIPAVIIWPLELMQIMTMDAIFKAGLSWEFILASTILAIVALRGSVSRKH